MQIAMLSYICVVNCYFEEGAKFEKFFCRDRETKAGKKKEKYADCLICAGRKNRKDQR